MSLELQHIFDTPMNTGFQSVTQAPAALPSLNFNSPFQSADLSCAIASNGLNSVALPAQDLLTQLYGGPFNLTALKPEPHDPNHSSGDSESTLLSGLSTAPTTSHSCTSSSTISSPKKNPNSSSSSSSSSAGATAPSLKAKRKRASKPLSSSSNSPGVSKRGRRISSNSTLPCPVCQQTYSRKDNLRAHMRVHSGEKPYKCAHCSESFRWLGALRKHKAANACNIRSSVCTDNSNDRADSTPYLQTVKREIRVIGEGDLLPSNNINQRQFELNRSTSDTKCIKNSEVSDGLSWSPEKSSDQLLSDYTFAESWSLPELNTSLLSIPGQSSQ